jgi:hypothetical protein
MKTRTLTLLGLLFSISASASAADSPARKVTRDRSFAGTMFDGAVPRLRRAVRPPARTAAELLADLQTRRLKQDEATDKAASAIWKEAADGRRRTLRRALRLADGTEGSRFKSFDQYAGRKIKLTDGGLVESASKVLSAVLAQEGTLGPGEEFRPESTRLKKFRSASETGPEESVIVGARVILRRHVDSVPIVGPEGAAMVVFDADGSLVELDFPITVYKREPVVATPRAGSVARQKSAFVAAGFSITPGAPGQIVQRRNHDVEVLDMQCGFREVESSDALEKGCLVSSVDGTQSPRSDFVKVPETD